MRPQKSKAAANRGQRGEQLAAAYLMAQGYSLLGQNLRTRYGELDLCLRRGALLVAVEVKTRSQHPAPERCRCQRKGSASAAPW